MHPLSRLAVLSLLVVATSGCDAINTASDTVDRAQLCTEALSAAGFNPDLSNPEQSVQDAQQRAQQLRDLAGQTTDADLQRELNDMADQMGQLDAGDITPARTAEWSQAKLEQLEQLRGACS